MPHLKLSQEYLDFIQKETGIKITLTEKNKSKLMNILSWFFEKTRINPEFRNNYFTTVGTTIYYPTHSEVLTEEQFFSVILHEVVHVIDYKRLGIFYILSYLFPQWLALVALVLGFITSKWWFLGLAFLGPLPAFGRFWFEARAFRATYHYYVLQNFNIEDKKFLVEKVKTQMTQRFYYFAWPFPKHVVKIFENDENFIYDKVYQLITKFLSVKK